MSRDKISTGVDDVWPPQWKPIKDSPQYMYGMITFFVDEMPWETDPSLYPSDAPYSRDEMMLFRKQIRESRGYDLTVFPDFAHFSPIKAKYCDKQRINWIQLKVIYALKEIRKQALVHGESYLLYSLKLSDIIEVYPSRCTLITFVVRNVDTNAKKTVQAMVYTVAEDYHELIEWRFKPDATASPDADAAASPMEVAAAASPIEVAAAAPTPMEV